jgi:hypothetical protein
MTPLPRNTPSGVPPQQQTEIEEPSLFEKLGQSLKQLWEQISDWLPGGDK